MLVLANIVRNLCAPYATMVVATCKQRVATAAALSEGIVNLVSSIWLARHIGALGVALGTLLGAITGVATHFAVSMRYTQATLAISRMELFVKGMLRPAAVAIPSVLILWRWWPAGTSSMTAYLYCGLVISTLLLAWFVSMSRTDRSLVAGMVSHKMNLP
jgi:O-antigen/teichoic acid export membrane protein